ncbi:MAG TPA: hypothetical protein VGI39_11950 [Polyangiaceae bacterium]|jgi:MYXO-CTERM domain-containing protein
MPRFTFPALASACLAVLVPQSAAANGRFPAAQQIAPSPKDAASLALMATFGVNLTRDDGANWDWTCEAAIGFQPNENPTLGVAADGSILIAAFEGLGRSTDGGCTWDFAASGIGDPVVDLDVAPSDPHSAFVLSSRYLGQDDAGETFSSRVWITHDDGAHFAQVGAALGDEILPETIAVAPSDPMRVYVSGTRTAGGAAVGVLLASRDGGVTFTESDLSFDPSADVAPFVAAVDPSNADRVYVRIQNSKGTRLLVSDDGAATTRQVWQAKGNLLGFAVSADGAKVYAGGPIDGLHVATRDALAFGAPVWPGAVQCLAFQGPRLLACSNELSGFAVGATTDDGASWTPLLHLACIRGPLACGAGSQEAIQCVPSWSAQQQILGGPSAVCGGDGVDGGDPSSNSPAGGHGEGCSTGSVSGPSGSLAGIVLVVAIAAAARRRR